MSAPTRPTPREGVEEHHCETAADFLEALSPRNQLWADDPTGWIYRGQGNADWALTAKAVRAHALFSAHGIHRSALTSGFVSPNPPDWSERAGLLIVMLLRFRAGLDRSGLVIPARSPRVDGGELNEITSNAEPLRESYPLALAQHHGLPTILLDWTRRAFAAAYFAAVVGADVNQRGGASHLAVWALYRTHLELFGEGPHFYEAPAGTNPNLNAQAGVFTSLALQDNDPSIEEHLWANRQKSRCSKSTLRRLSMPTSEAPKLLRLLSYEGITGASMFPGADGVVRAMREIPLWDIQPNFGE